MSAITAPSDCSSSRAVRINSLGASSNSSASGINWSVGRPQCGFAGAYLAHFKGRFAVALCLRVFLDDVGPAARADVRPIAVCDAEQIGLALHETHREAVHGKNIERLECHGVVAAQHVLIAQQVGEIGRERMAHALVVDAGDDLATAFKARDQIGGPSPLANPSVVPTPALGGIRVFPGSPCTPASPPVPAVRPTVAIRRGRAKTQFFGTLCWSG